MKSKEEKWQLEIQLTDSEMAYNKFPNESNLIAKLTNRAAVDLRLTRNEEQNVKPVN